MGLRAFDDLTPEKSRPVEEDALGKHRRRQNLRLDVEPPAQLARRSFALGFSLLAVAFTSRKNIVAGLKKENPRAKRLIAEMVSNRICAE